MLNLLKQPQPRVCVCGGSHFGSYVAEPLLSAMRALPSWIVVREP